MTDAVVLDGGGIRRGSSWVWRDASFRLASGSFAAIVGPNGAGKSTLLGALLGIVPLTEGSVSVCGRVPRRGDPSIGYMPQSRVMDPDLAIRGWDVVRFGVDGFRWGFAFPGQGAKDRSRRIQAVLTAVGAERYAGRRLGSLSGGEAQRIFLAQALIGEPAVLLLDEPLANLDPANSAAIVALIASIAKSRGIAVLMVSHDVNGLLPYLDTVVYIANGSVAAGPVDDIISSATLSHIYGTEIEVLRDRRGNRIVLAPEQPA